MRSRLRNKILVAAAVSLSLVLVLSLAWPVAHTANAQTPYPTWPKTATVNGTCLTSNGCPACPPGGGGTGTGCPSSGPAANYSQGRCSPPYPGTSGQCTGTNFDCGGEIYCSNLGPTGNPCYSGDWCD
jgi:hypothetical protein